MAYHTVPIKYIQGSPYFENALKNSYAPIFGAFLFLRSFFKDYLLHFWITLYFNHCFSYVLCDYIQALLWLCCTIQSVAVLFYISIMMWLFLCWFCCASFTLLIWHCNSNDTWGMVWYSMIWQGNERGRTWAPRWVNLSERVFAGMHLIENLYNSCL